VPSDAESFDPLPLLQALSGAGVDFVVIGGVAGGAHGSSYPTYDLDIAYGRDRPNLERLAHVLRGLEATLRAAPPSLPFLLDADTLQAGAHLTFTTRYGPLDILDRPDGSPPYAELKRAATRAEVRGSVVNVASLDHLIAMKEASGRAKDRLMATELRALSDELRAPRE
jgi:hypothetical protein